MELEPFWVENGEARDVKLSLGTGEKRSVTAFVLGLGEADSTGDAREARGEARGDARATTRFSLTVDLAGEGAEFHFAGLFVATGSAHADIDVRVNHLAPGCTSRQLLKGIAGGTATGAFTGMVHVAPGAQKTDASQRNQNLQLSDTAHIHARPQLEIYADDVRCSHGATVGRLDPDAIYYMRQRGISENEARRMQMQGFAGEIVMRCPSESSREQIGTRITDIIDRL